MAVGEIPSSVVNIYEIVVSTAASVGKLQLFQNAFCFRTLRNNRFSRH